MVNRLLSKKFPFGIVFAFLALQMPLLALPSQVMIIRHGEKPEEGHGLSLKGRERAEALAPFFSGNSEFLKHGLPVAIYAQKISQANPSMRPMQTVTPLAQALNLNIQAEYEHAEYAKMVEAIKTNPEYQGKNVLICWEHQVIPEMTQLFGVKKAPEKWDGETFDRVWLIEFASEKEAAFKNVAQRLLFGDSP